MSARVRWLVSPKGLRWVVERNGYEQRRFLWQWRAISWAAAQAARDWSEWHIPGELLIQGRNGKYRDARSYGNDPREIRG